ncbi:MAG: VCBS repeat-containing protein [Gammaproteobacteria bacterium]|nr:VCBS repeat-containing protein [Gammaproteobacteria bacterium]
MTSRVRAALVFAVAATVSPVLLAATPGLPFTEEFNDTQLRDTARTTADWNTSLGVLAMQRRRPLQNFIDSGSAGLPVGNKSVSALSIALGDLDGDGDLDLSLVGGSNDRYFLNNGSSTPFTSSTSYVNFTNSNSKSGEVALEDFDLDGDLDVVVAKLVGSVKNLVYFNNGSDAPFLNVVPVELGSLAAVSGSVDTGDLDGDGDPDIVIGNENTGDRYYLNQGDGTFSTDLAIPLPAAKKTKSLRLGDMNRDGRLDLVVATTLDPVDSPDGPRLDIAVGDVQGTYLYLNNGSSSPFAGVVPTRISDDENKLWDSGLLELGDLNGDGFLDVLVGNLGYDRVYLNNGAGPGSDPFAGVVGYNVSSDQRNTHSVVLVDIDGDGDLDYLAGNKPRTHGLPADNVGTDRLYLNNGNGFFQPGVDISSDVDGPTTSLAVGDLDTDGDMDIAASRDQSIGRYFLNTGVPGSGAEVNQLQSHARSLRVDNGSVALNSVKLAANQTIPFHTRIRYWLSNDGGTHWKIAYPGRSTSLNSGAAPDLRWRAELMSASPASLPRINSLSLGLDLPISVAISAPATGSSYSLGASVSFAGTATDPEDGNLSGSLSWSSSRDGVIGSGAGFSTTALSAGTHTITASVTDSSGATASDSIVVTVVASGGGGGSGAFQQEANGSVSIEAEHYDASVEHNGVQWNGPVFPSGASGGQAMEAPSASGQPRLEYRVDFSATGTYYVWIRSYALNASTNSVHLGKPESARAGGGGGTSNVPPVPVITTPATGSSYSQGVTVSFGGTATDTEDGNLAASLSWSSSRDGSIGSGAGFSTTGLSVGTHTITASVTDSGGATASDSIVVTVVASGGGGGSGAFQQEADGSVSIEAENYDASVEHNGVQWNGPVFPSGASGGQAMEAPSAASQPRLEYRVDFSATGTYYVWIRSYALNASTNSVHLGSDGSWFNDVVSVSPYNSWQWEGPYTLNVSSTGVHTLGITRRESQTQVDKLFIGTSSNATPSGTGAPESARAGGGGGTSNVPPVPVITTPATGSSYSQGATVSFGGTATDTEDGNLAASLSWSSSRDGSIGSGAGFSTTALSAGTHTITASVTDSGGATASDSIVVTVVASGGGGGGSGAFQQEANGTVSIEAEHYDANVEGGSTQWNGPAFPSGASGGQAMEAPADGQPRLEYRVDFSTAGTYYVWIRSYAFDGSSNSVRFGSDGGWLDQLVTISPFNSWQWEGPFTLDVGSVGCIHWVSPGVSR